MTTDILVDFAQDIFVENNVMNFDTVNWPMSSPLAGASWVATEASPNDSLLAVLQFLFVKVRANFPSAEVCLLVGTSAWQPNNRVVRYHRLWGALKARGLAALGTDQRSEEVLLESDKGLKFFGAARLSDMAIEDAVQVLLSENCSYLVVLLGDISPRDLIDVGWSGDMAKDFRIINRIADSDSLLLKKIGEFDDKGIGVVAIGRQNVVKTLLA
ncbi:MAG: hypothetical protein HOP03_11605 [Lysobacter sp.]|nr:hypothetical protein [Lysobacter sp.]